MNNITEAMVTIGTAIVGIAIIAVLVSQRSNTAGVVNAFGTAFSGALGVAVSPVASNGGMGYTGFSGVPTIGGYGM